MWATRWTSCETSVPCRCAAPWIAASSSTCRCRRTSGSARCVARSRFARRRRVAGAAARGAETLFVLTPCAAPAPPQVDPAQCSLLVTEPLFNLPVLMARCGSHGLPWHCMRRALTPAAALRVLLCAADAVRRAHLRADGLPLRAHCARARAGRARPAAVRRSRRRCAGRACSRAAGAPGGGAGRGAAVAHHARAGLRLLIHVRSVRDSAGALQC